jgi:YD repeat-containing protein
MNKRRLTLIRAFIFALAVALMLAGDAHADQAQYFYDELGRLVGVVDGQGNVAVYNYDAVGNLLSIDRFATGGTGIGIFLVAPASAVIGANVQIRGFGFSTTMADNQVKFNGTTATVVSASATTIVATVPSGATTGPVTVTNANGTATSPKTFTVLVPPIISGLSPERAAQGTSSRVVIEGFNLSTATSVTFTQSGLSATIQGGATDQSLPITLNVGAAVPPGLYSFSVVSPVGTAQSGTVKVTVTAAVPSFGITKGSVFRPFPAQTPPSGISTSVSSSVSMSMP